MKRHASLQDLSRDHHHSLVVARRLRRASAEDAGAVAAAFLEHWRTEGAEHFREEEDELLPAFARHGDAEDPLVARVLVEHVLIRADAQAVEERPEDLDLLHRLGERMAHHVRLEERELFPLIEATLSDEP